MTIHDDLASDGAAADVVAHDCSSQGDDLILGTAGEHLQSAGSDRQRVGEGTPRRRRSRAVLYASIAVAVLLAVLITLLASTKPVANSVASSPLLGKPAPSVSGKALGGSGSYTLGAFRGRWVLLNFSASWCIPCRNETPQLLDFQKEHAASGDATVFAVEFDPSDQANLAAFLASSHSTWPAINDPSAEVSYGVTGIPESYLIDPAGTVVAKFFGGVTAAQVDKSITQASS